MTCPFHIGQKIQTVNTTQFAGVIAEPERDGRVGVYIEGFNREVVILIACQLEEYNPLPEVADNPTWQGTS